MAMAFQIITSSSSSSSLTITKSHFHSYPPLQSSYKASKPNLSSCFSLMGSSRFSPYIGLKHLGISISPKSSNPERKRRCKGMMIRASLFGVGAPEALVIGVVALLVFGPKGLAEVARNLGKTLRTFQPTIRELQDVSRDFKSTLEREIGLDDINVYNQNRMNSVQPPPPPPSVPSTEDPVTANDPNDAQSPKAYTTEDYLKITEEQLKASSPGESRADDAQSPKAYTTEDYLKITEEQLKALSPGESQTEDQTKSQEPLQPTTVQTPTGESQPNGTARETTAPAPPRQD